MGRSKFDALTYSCIPYGFNVDAHGAAVKEALKLIDLHIAGCPYCLGKKLPASPFGSPLDLGGDVR